MQLLIRNAKQLVTVSSFGKRAKVGEELRELNVIYDGCVFIEDGLIRWVGRTEEFNLNISPEVEILDASDRIVMPGFVDAHTHLVFAGTREQEFSLRTRGYTYQQIAEQGGGITNTVKAVRDTTKKDLKKGADKRLDSMLRFGTTTAEIKTGYGLDFKNEVKMLEAINELGHEHPVDIVPTFLGAHAVPPEFERMGKDYVELVVSEMIPYVARKKMAVFCDVFCEEGYFGLDDSRRILKEGKKSGLMPKIHADELTSAGGAELAAEVGAVSADHLENVSEAGIHAMADKAVVAVLLPGVSFFLGHKYAPARELIEARVPVALATDFNPGSCMSENMQLMMTIACTQMKMTPEEVIAASTLNAAAALSLSDQTGSIEVGKKADLLVLNIPSYEYLPYHFGVNHVERVVKHGKILEFGRR
jgi:imidazolonepropionase